jgi:hypothetical protein
MASSSLFFELPFTYSWTSVASVLMQLNTMFWQNLATYWNLLILEKLEYEEVSLRFAHKEINAFDIRM